MDQHISSNKNKTEQEIIDLITSQTPEMTSRATSQKKSKKIFFIVLISFFLLGITGFGIYNYLNQNSTTSNLPEQGNNTSEILTVAGCNIPKQITNFEYTQEKQVEGLRIPNTANANFIYTNNSDNAEASIVINRALDTESKNIIKKIFDSQEKVLHKYYEKKECTVTEINATCYMSNAPDENKALIMWLDNESVRTITISASSKNKKLTNNDFSPFMESAKTCNPSTDTINGVRPGMCVWPDSINNMRQLSKKLDQSASKLNVGIQLDESIKADVYSYTGSQENTTSKWNNETTVTIIHTNSNDEAKKIFNGLTADEQRTHCEIASIPGSCASQQWEIFTDQTKGFHSFIRYQEKEVIIVSEELLLEKLSPQDTLPIFPKIEQELEDIVQVAKNCTK